MSSSHGPWISINSKHFSVSGPEILTESRIFLFIFKFTSEAAQSEAHPRGL